MNNLQVTAKAVTDNLHNTAKQAIRTRARLAAWVVARQHGVGVEACDAIADATLESFYDYMREWAEEE